MPTEFSNVAVEPSHDTASGTFVVSSGSTPAMQPHTPKALLSPPVRAMDQPGEESNDSTQAAVADLEKLCDRLIVTNLDDDDDDDDDVDPSPSALRMDWLAPNGSAGGKSSAASSAKATGGLTGVVGGAEPAPPPGGFFHLVINPDPALLPTFNSSKSVEDILLDQARYGPYVRAASYEQVNKTFLAQRPPGLPLTAPPWGRHNDASNPGQAATQVFIGQLPSFASEEWLTMCLEFVYGAPGSVHYTVVRRESTGTQAGYALATLGDPSLVPVFINLSRHIFFGKKNVFYTDPAQNHVNEFQRIIARVMAIDATRPHPEVSTVGYARACLVIATANPPSRSPVANAGQGRGRGGGGSGRGGGRQNPHHGGGGGSSMASLPPPAYAPGAGGGPNLSPPPPPFAATFAGGVSAHPPTTPPASGSDNVWGAPPLLSPKDIAAAQRGGSGHTHTSFATHPHHHAAGATNTNTGGHHHHHHHHHHHQHNQQQQHQHQRVPQPRHAPAPRSTGLPGYESHRSGHGSPNGNYSQVHAKNNKAPPPQFQAGPQHQNQSTGSSGHHTGPQSWTSQPPVYQPQQQQQQQQRQQPQQFQDASAANAASGGHGPQHFQQAYQQTYQPQHQQQAYHQQPQLQQQQPSYQQAFASQSQFHQQQQQQRPQEQQQQLYTMSSTGEYVPVPMQAQQTPQVSQHSWGVPAPVTVISPPLSAGSVQGTAWTPPPSA